MSHRLIQPPVFKDNCRVYKSAARIACRPDVALEFGPGIPLRRGSASGDFAGRSCKICKFCRLSTCPAPASPGAQAARSTPFARSSCSGSRTTPSHRGRSTSGSSSPRLFSWRLVPCCTSCCTSCPTTAAARTRKRHEVRRKLRRELRRELRRVLRRDLRRRELRRELRREPRRELRRELRREGGQEHVDVRRRVRVQGRLQERQDGGQVHVHRRGRVRGRLEERRAQEEGSQASRARGRRAQEEGGQVGFEVNFPSGRARATFEILRILKHPYFGESSRNSVKFVKTYFGVIVSPALMTKMEKR